jgi:protein-tyrosine phosphatase
MERVELHFHLLPGVDDGPRDLAGALDLARAAVADGTGVITCTPHAHQIDFAEIPARVRRMQAALDAAGVDLEVRGGAELMWSDVAGLDDEALDSVAQGPPAGRWLLLEAPLPGTGPLVPFEATARELRERGFGLLIGHPERSPDLMAAPAAVDRLLAAGDRLQVNGSSLIGYHGSRPRALALELVRSGRVMVIASDAHQPVDRGPTLSRAVAMLREHGIAFDDAQELVAAGPHALLDAGIAPARRLAA